MEPPSSHPALEADAVRVDGRRVLIKYPNGTYTADCHDEQHATELAQDIKRYISAMDVPATYGGIERLLAEID